ncbi:MAG: NAD(P)-binding domain-containing protein [Enterococcus hulanensis]
MNKAVIIGAGQNGRGLIAPIVKKNGYQITFLDKDHELITHLQNEKSYNIYYFGNKKQELINNYNAFPNDSKEAEEALAEAQVVFISVFADNISSLVPILKKTESSSRCIVCCENGVNVKQPLIDAKLKDCISEGIIFCTTLRLSSKDLDLWSEDFVELPIDNVPGIVSLSGMPLEDHFSSLIQRKIYTYNFISALVAYLGNYLGYKSYGEASNDSTIAQIIQNIIPSISKMVAKEFLVSYTEQLEFTNRAVLKFSNREIVDSIYRNARQSSRKLGMNERLMVPLKLSIKYNEDTSYIETIIAAAMHYAVIEEEFNVDYFMELFDREFNNPQLKKKILFKYGLFCEGTPLTQIIQK